MSIVWCQFSWVLSCADFPCADFLVLFWGLWPELLELLVLCADNPELWGYRCRLKLLRDPKLNVLTLDFF